MQLQLLQTHQALGRGNPQSLILVLHELVLYFSPMAEFPCVLLSTPLCPTASQLSWGDLHGEAWFSLGAGTTYTCPLCCS